MDYTHGKPHCIQDLIQKVRKIFLEMGFDEVENPVFVSEDDIYKQYGSEAAVILDRCYYLAGLDRPDIGLSKEKISEISNYGVNESNIDELKKVLREYRENVIEGDDLIEMIVKRVNLKTEQALNLVSSFEEFKNLTPKPSKITLRSHMTASWFITLEALRSKPELNLFSIGLRFRREQKQDATHLRAHYGASCVVMRKDFSLEKDGFDLSNKIFSKLGFKDLNFVKKHATSNYYENNLEYEIFSGKIEIGDCGMYSKRALKNYKISAPVFNLGFGLERILMVKNNIGDVREVMFPQFYLKDLSDSEISEGVKIAVAPSSDEGKILSGKIKETSLKYAKERSPCDFVAYEGSFMKKKIKVTITKREEGKFLLGPAALNEVYIYDGNIYGLPQDDKWLKEAKTQGIRKFSFMDAISDFFAKKIEDLIAKEKGKEKKTYFEIKNAQLPSDVNIEISDDVRRFITSKQKKILIKGPVFVGVEVEIQ